MVELRNIAYGVASTARWFEFRDEPADGASGAANTMVRHVRQYAQEENKRRNGTKCAKARRSRGRQKVKAAASAAWHSISRRTNQNISVRRVVMPCSSMRWGHKMI